MAKKTVREQLAEDKRNQEAAYAKFDEKKAARGVASGKMKAAPTKPTAAQVHSKKAESHRAKYTPPGMQALVDVMGKKKKPKGTY